MNRDALRVLKIIAEANEIPLDKAVRLAKVRHHNHLDQYPLALLIEEGYVGLSIDTPPPPSGESMRELFQAINLHMWSLPPDDNGKVQYKGIILHDVNTLSLDCVFIKAKGALYLAELREKRKDRIVSFVLGLIAGLIIAVSTAWLDGKIDMDGRVKPGHDVISSRPSK